MTRITVLLTFLFLTPGFSALAQIERAKELEVVKRIEMELKDGKHSFHFVSKGENGGLITHKKETSKENTQERHFIELNSDLEETGASSSYTYEKPMQYIRYDRVGSTLHMLNYAKKLENIEYRALDMQTLEFTNTIITELPAKRRLESFAVGEKVIFLLSRDRRATHKRKKYALSVLNLETQNVKTIEVNPKAIFFPELRYDGLREMDGRKLYEIQFEVDLGSKGHKRMVLLYDEEANLVGDPLMIDLGKDKEMLSFRFEKLENNDYLMAGIYSSQRDFWVEGIFSGIMDETGNVKSLKTSNLFDIESFANANPTALDLKERGKKRVKVYKNKALTHELIWHNDKWYVVYEFYRPIFSFHDSGFGDKTRHFDGYDFNEAMVVALDESANFLWSDTFPIFTPELTKWKRRHLSFSPHGSGDFGIFYTGEGHTIVRTYNSSGELYNEGALVFEEANGVDSIIRTWGKYTMHCTDGFYYSTGIIKIEELDGDETKSVKKSFFVLKLKY